MLTFVLSNLRRLSPVSSCTYPISRSSSHCKPEADVNTANSCDALVQCCPDLYRMCEHVFSGHPKVVYSVRVYDNSPATDSTSAAYQHSQLIHIMELHQPSPTAMSKSEILLLLLQVQ